MPSKSTVFKLGFTGSTLDEILPWSAAQVGDADTVVMAMAGSGKDIAYLARPQRTIYSWDTQELSRCVVQGLFAAPAQLGEPLARGYLEGYAFREAPIAHIPGDAAGLADWIATAGSDYDRVCLSQALMRCTFMGRLKVWQRAATADDLWAHYLRAFAKLAPWRGLPGTFVHRKGSVFENVQLLHQLAEDQLLYIDTPKVITSGKKGDIYSVGFGGMNSILAQERQELPPWTEATFRRDMPHLWTAPAKRMLLFHATGCQPEPPQVLEAMLKDGVPFPTTVKEWVHKGRADVCWVVDRDSDPFWS
jgi:hypothetical protein